MNYLKPYINSIDVASLNLNNKIRLAWSLCASEIFDYEILSTLVEDLNQMPFENPYNELHHEEFLMLKDIYYSISFLNKTNPKLAITNESIKRFAKSSNELEKGYHEYQAKVSIFLRIL